MNFLAHAYLSFNQPHILVVNMISDFVKGSLRFSYSEKIQNGIMLHRQIDNFTDQHPATQRSKEIFRPYYRLYSGPIMDILYDHYLANDKSIFNESSLKEFTLSTYSLLDQFSTQLPDRFARVLTYMKSEDWLFNYRQKESMRNSLYGLSRRSVYLKETETAFQLFINKYEFLNECYSDFFKDVKLFTKEKLKELTS